ncbi:MAG: hypothetical protein QNJ37_10230 [Crocosphaera sp.]|nr:hypothetical protein [Crocosphaera sp.]
MKFSERRFIEDYQSNALDLGYETVTQRHHGQKWKYQYPRHIRPHFSTLSKLETRSHDPLESPVMIPQRSKSRVCSISTNIVMNFPLSTEILHQYIKTQQCKHSAFSFQQ